MDGRGCSSSMPLLDVRRASTAEECLKGMRLAACGTCTGAKAWSCSAGGDHDKDQGGVRERSTECPKLHKQPRRRRAEHVRMKWVYGGGYWKIRARCRMCLERIVCIDLPIDSIY